MWSNRITAATTVRSPELSAEGGCSRWNDTGKIGLWRENDDYQTTGALVPGRAHCCGGPLELSAPVITGALATTTLTPQTKHL